MRRTKKRLGEMLVEAGLITQEQLDEALVQKRTGEKLGDALMRLNYLTETQLIQVLHEQLNVPVISLYAQDINVTVTKLVPKVIAQKHDIMPIELQGNTLFIATADPLDLIAIDDVRLQTGMNIEVGIATREQIRKTISRYYEMDASLIEILKEEAPELEREETASRDDAPVIRLVNQLFLSAIDQRASDIHFDPHEKQLHVRFRVDGDLRTETIYPKKIQSVMLTRLKVMSNLDITESRLPQDGRIKYTLRGRPYDFRVSTLPTMYGEKIVIRVLDSSEGLTDLTKLGFGDQNEAVYRDMLKRPNGIILITGPTGSGKSSTLYASLRELNEESKNIITVEDPVEYQLDGINQVQVNAKVGLTFASGLRSILRQDPNIVMVGEIRDTETAEIAIRASLTGHLVLSTLHTNSAISSITRLIDMGVEPFLVAASTSGLVAQRLVRRVCRDCGHEQPVSKREQELFAAEGVPVERIMRGNGCASCNFTGYRGRLAIHEVVPIDEGLRRLIMNQATEAEMVAYAKAQGARFLLADGLEKVAFGLTNTEEILRTVITE
ncbi:ATPase, T2SS/T4P/T4SS family [Exiguobacterium sp. s7]|uniref:GspE/PulE family protein n=1 Tax=Exiguobacterium sp. s7 TaxID=2751235 RepID=UPI001BE51658